MKKQPEKMSNNQLIEFAMKLQKTLLQNQNALATESNQITARLNEIDKNLDSFKTENKQVYIKVSVPENTSKISTENLQDANKKLEEVEMKIYRMQEYFRRGYIGISVIRKNII